MYGNGYFNIHRAQSTAMRNLTARTTSGVFLDAGCGDSPDADLALELGFSQAYAVDLFPADKIITGYNKPIVVKSKAEFILGDMCEELPLEDSSLDAISSNWVVPLMSPDDRELFYGQVKRMLKPKGIFSVTGDTMVSGYGHGELFQMRNEHKRLQKVGFKSIERSVAGIICYK